jgi:hypothetical protein
MAEAGNTRTTAGKAKTTAPAKTRQESQRPAAGGLSDDILNLQRTAGNRAVGELLTRAAQESAQHLDENVRVPMEQALGANLSGVRVHSGTPSHAAAESIGARAYTIGSDIYLGSDAQHLNAAERNALLAHEAVHTIQQGGQPVSIQGKMDVSQPGDSAEVEAENISKSIMSETAARTPSFALGLRDQLRATPIARATVSRLAAPLIQRDLKKPYPVDEGTWTLDLKTESHKGAQSGMSGTLKFKANAKAPDADQIGILQVARTEDLTTGKELAWTGDEAARNKIQSPGGTGMGAAGYFVDVLHKNRKPRSKKGAAEVSPYYIDDYTAYKSPQDVDGSKKGKSVTEASIYDFPSSDGKVRFSFETVAKDRKGGHVFGSVAWGFTISDPAKGTVDHEWAERRNVTLKSTDLAIEAFNKYYKNPGTPGAP